MEVAERELDRMIERRSGKAPDPEELEPSYAESVRRFNARRRQQNRALWFAYFSNLARNLRARADEYEQRAEKLLEEGEA